MLHFCWDNSKGLLCFSRTCRFHSIYFEVKHNFLNFVKKHVNLYLLVSSSVFLYNRRVKYCSHIDIFSRWTVMFYFKYSFSLSILLILDTNNIMRCIDYDIQCSLHVSVVYLRPRIHVYR